MGMIEQYGELADAQDVAKGIALWVLDTFHEACGGAITEAGGELEVETSSGTVSVLVMSWRERTLMSTEAEKGAGRYWLTVDERKLIDDRRAKQAASADA